MKQIKCNQCGGNLVEKTFNIYRCLSCGREYKDGIISDEEQLLIFSAYEILRKGDFDEAFDKFQSIIDRFPKSHQAYFGQLLAKNGIIFIDDITEGKKIPTCNMILNESLFEDVLYKESIKNAPIEIRENYKQQIEKIENIRVEWLDKAKQEKPYDVFLCYKESDKENNITRTKDSLEAEALYIHLIQKGYKVFFARQTLRDKISDQYEPYIFNALNTAPVMIVYGSKKEYFESTWVKNEWNRFIKKIANKEKQPNSLIVCYEDMDAYSLPKNLTSRQCLNANTKTFYIDLEAHIEKVIKSSTSIIPIEILEIVPGVIAKKEAKFIRKKLTETALGNVSVKQLTQTDEQKVKTGFMMLEKELFSNAETIFENILIENKENGKAYWGLLLCLLKVKNDEDISNLQRDFKDSEINLLNESIKYSSAEDGERYLQMISGYLFNIFSKNQDSKLDLLKKILVYKSKIRNDIILQCMDIAINNINISLFEMLLEYTDPNTKYVYLKKFMRITSNKSLFSLTQKYNDLVLMIDEGDTEALVTKLKLELKCDCNCFFNNYYGEHINNLTENQYPLIELILKYSANETKMLEELTFLLEAIIDTLIDDNSIRNFEQLIKYVSSENKRIYFLEKMGNKCLGKSFFENSKRYFSIIIDLDSKNYQAYFGLLKCNLECTNDDELLMISEELSLYPEFQSALTCGYNDEDFINKLLDLLKKQDSVEYKEKRFFVRKKRLFESFHRELFRLYEIIKSIKVKNFIIKNGNLKKIKKGLEAKIYLPINVSEVSFQIIPSYIKEIHFLSKPKIISHHDNFKLIYETDNIEMINMQLSELGVEDTFEYKKMLDSLTKSRLYLQSYREINSVIGKKISSRYKYIDIPNTISNIERNSFDCCQSLSGIIIPSSVISIGNNAFNGCYNLKSIIVDDDNQIYDSRNNCNAIIHTSTNELLIGCENATIPSSVTSIGKRAFYGCTSLASITIPASVTSIGDRAFYKCSSLKSITIPGSVTSIGELAFAYCRNLTIYCEVSIKPNGWHSCWNPENVPVYFENITSCEKTQKSQNDDKGLYSSKRFEDRLRKLRKSKSYQEAYAKALPKLYNK